MSIDETRRVLKISKHPISLDRPIGESEDSYFGDFIEDDEVDSPVAVRDAGNAQGQNRYSFKDAFLPRTRNYQAALRYRRRLHLHARRSRQNFQSHARTCPPGRGKGDTQTSAPGAKQKTRRFPRL